MILCVTLNPCLDKTLIVPDWTPGDNVRGTAAHEVVGGKGNNVARALRHLGRAARPVTFLGGAVGERCEALFRLGPEFDPILVRTSAPTREIVTVRAPGVAATTFFDPDPLITPGEVDVLLRRVEAELDQGGIEAITLSGSSPCRATDGAYSDLIALAQARRIPVFLDTYGPALAAIWGFWPDAISLNRREASMLLGHPQPDAIAIRRLLHQWSRRGVETAVVTDGPDEVLALIQGEYYRIKPPAIDAVNPIGSGDCLVAGLVDARLNELAPEAMLRRAVATAVANALVWDAGAVDPAEVGRLEAAIRVESWSS